MKGKLRALGSCMQDSNPERLKKTHPTAEDPTRAVRPVGMLFNSSSPAHFCAATSCSTPFSACSAAAASLGSAVELCPGASPVGGPHPRYLCFPFLPPAQPSCFLSSSLSARGDELKFNFPVGSVLFLLWCMLLSPSFHPLFLPFRPSHPFLPVRSVG